MKAGTLTVSCEARIEALCERFVQGAVHGSGRLTQRRRTESGSHKVQHDLRTISYKVEFISRSKRGASHFSSDLERAPGAQSIAVEFVEAPRFVTEVLRCENTAFHFHPALIEILSLERGTISHIYGQIRLKKVITDPIHI